MFDIDNMTDDEIRAELENSLKWIEKARTYGYEYDLDAYFVDLVKEARPDIYKSVVGA